MTTRFPRMQQVRQIFSTPPIVDPAVVIPRELAPADLSIRPGMQIAVGVGSRGVANLPAIVRHVIGFLRDRKAEVFIVPAMGSHGGATPEGQIQLLADYGVTATAMGVPVRAGMEVDVLGTTADGLPMYFSREALAAEGIVLINRIKPHTDFRADIGSGLMKMLVVGLGKRAGAAQFHIASSRHGYERVLRTTARGLLARVPLLCGVGLTENQFHQTVGISVVKPADLERREGELFHEARALMPKLPFDDIDLLIVDRIGKNISGAGLDPNVTGRGIHGYSSLLGDRSNSPVIRRLFVRGLTPESHGNATGIGMADFTTDRLVESINYPVTAVNVLTALSLQAAKIPIHFATDREVINAALESLALPEGTAPTVMRIADTLSLEIVELSEAFAPLLSRRSDLQTIADSREMAFDNEGNLRDMIRP